MNQTNSIKDVPTPDMVKYIHDVVLGDYWEKLWRKDLEKR